ncbi:MAG: RsmD family RNA methyltransferase [Pseudomonadota bacterium]|nr:RsmD family RNA methyltransferase [Pseudomonadota bacterium]
MPAVRVAPLPAWLPRERLLGPAAWHHEGAVATAELGVPAAADLAARLRGVGLGGQLLEVEVTPALPRAAVRAARTTDARRRRDASPGFSRPGVRLDEEGQVSLTPEALALALGRPLAGCRVVDATCGAGGNTIGFARAGAQVVAVEQDAARLALARHNAGIYGMADRIRFVRGDALLEVGRLHADVLFIDPPWGVDWDRARTGLASVPLLAALLPLARAAGIYGAIWAKVPPSFDPAEWPEAQVEAVFGAGEGDARRVKFLVFREARDVVVAGR